MPLRHSSFYYPDTFAFYGAGAVYELCILEVLDSKSFTVSTSTSAGKMTPPPHGPQYSLNRKSERPRFYFYKVDLSLFISSTSSRLLHKLKKYVLHHRYRSCQPRKFSFPRWISLSSFPLKKKVTGTTALSLGDEGRLKPLPLDWLPFNRL